MTEAPTENTEPTLIVTELNQLRFITGLSLATANIGLVPVDPDSDHKPSVFDQTLILVTIDHQGLIDKDGEPIRDDSRNSYLMEPDHALERALGMARCAIAAMKHSPIAPEKFVEMMLADSAERTATPE